MLKNVKLCNHSIDYVIHIFWKVLVIFWLITKVEEVEPEGMVGLWKGVSKDGIDTITIIVKLAESRTKIITFF